jgi:hypothetical protein
MEPADVVLFLGAGISTPTPTGAPMFAEVRDACAELVGVPVTHWDDTDARRMLLNHVIPEVFLKALVDAGYELEHALSAAVSGGAAAKPNAGHRLAARVINAGGMVWTTNWDHWIEDAHRASFGRSPQVSVYGADAPPNSAGLGKLHGSVVSHQTLMFRTPQIIKPLAADWHDALVASVQGRVLIVAGYAGADVDLFKALRDASHAADACFWFEGNGDTPLDGDPLADYERWRFELDSVVLEPKNLPTSGRHLVWCGRGSTASDPSRGLLDAMGDSTPSGGRTPWADRYALVKRNLSAVPHPSGRSGRELLLQASVRERLADRRGAARKHLQLLVVGSARERVKALRSLRNLTVLRSARLRETVNWLYQALPIRGDDADFLRRHAGDLSHDAERAARIAAGDEDVSIDGALNVAAETRWGGDLVVAETIARSALGRVLALDLSRTDRDWPERVSRAAYEYAQALLWQGKFFDADAVCRTAQMRVSGAKWTAWEFSIRAAVRYAHGDYPTAAKHFATCETILEQEGFADFGIAVATGRAAAARAMGDLDGARDHHERAATWPRPGLGSSAAALAEGAELALLEADQPLAVQRRRDLTHVPMPLWKGLAHLRLAELGQDKDHNLDEALDAFSRANSTWGTIRATALREGHDHSQIQAAASNLGPVEVFTPGGPWVI